MPKDLSAQQVGQQIRSKAASPKQHVVTGRSDFPMSYDFPNTYRYGHIQPFYYQHTIGDDDIPLFSEHQLSTYTLSSPLKADVRMNKSYFLVDFKSIYPRNWNLMYVAPKKGDDVPADNRFVTSILLNALFKRWQILRNVDVSEDKHCTDFMNFVILMESVYSAGSLFAQFNIHLQDFARSYLPSDIDRVKPLSFDTWFDTFFVDIIINSDNFRLFVNGNGYALSSDGTSFFNSETDTYYVSLRRLLELMRSHPFTCRGLDAQFVQDAISTLTLVDINNYPLNLEILAAYQLGCAQFFTDSNIDFVYSADMYRKAVETKMLEIYGASNARVSFTYNGQLYLYDILSGHYLNIFLTSIGSNAIGDIATLRMYDYFSMIFGHRNSLRFGDYFVSGRISPYGTGDLTVNTSGATVSVVDITRKIQLQRFWNKVNLSGQKFGEYARNVMGLSNADDNSYDIPAYLGHKSLPIGGMEIENTGSEQREANAITSVLKARQNVHAFDIHTKRPGIIIGVMTFDVHRVYSKTVDRMHLHQNRFDDFIPEMQFVGDQQIYQRELDSSHPVNGIFAYTTRYMEYKSRYSYAAGGAIEALKSWYFITDNKDGNPFIRNIDPDYIRSQPTEFDRFYSSLTGYSLGTYFHFNVKNRNFQELTRDMFVAPQPLL